jgi:tRNA threonylcarbamoyladenosine biosynthesis protein TsaB
VSTGGELKERFEIAPMRHAELLLPAVSSMLAEAGLTLGDLDAIAFGRGPGSFTSLRIGIGVVQGLAWGADLPVVPVSSLAAAAQEAADQAAGSPGCICVAMDARMQETYCCQFAVNGNGLVRFDGEERVCSPEAAFAGLDQQFTAVGNGFERFAELKQIAGRAEFNFPAILPRASSTVKLALDWLKSRNPLPAALAQPVYIRNKVADKPAPF